AEIRLGDEYVRFILGKIFPSLPRWCEAGFVDVYDVLDFTSSVTRLQMLIWRDRSQTQEIAEARVRPGFDAENYRIPILSLGDFLAAEPRPDMSPEDANLWRAEAALFVRWALFGDSGRRRNAFWDFVRRSSKGETGEEFFRSIFNLSYTEAEKSLKVYLLTN